MSATTPAFVHRVYSALAAIQTEELPQQQNEQEINQAFCSNEFLYSALRYFL